MRARSAVAGRLVNCYSSNDWLLALLYRSKSYDLNVAGLAPVQLPQRPHDVENLDVSSLVSSHSDYTLRLRDIFEWIRL